jgi:transposase
LKGIDSERGIAWRASDSLAVRAFLRLPVDEPPPDHTTISRTRRAIDLESHRAVFTWVQQRLVAAGLLKGKTVAVDATTLEANAAMRSIVRRDTGESYQEFLSGLAQTLGIAPTCAEVSRFLSASMCLICSMDTSIGCPWHPIRATNPVAFAP